MKTVEGVAEDYCRDRQVHIGHSGVELCDEIVNLVNKHFWELLA